MSEYDKPKQPEFDPNFRIPSTEDLLNSARKAQDAAQETLQNPPTISDTQKAIILTVVGTYVLFRIEKRMVRKVVTKVVRKDNLIIKEHLNQLTAAIEDLTGLSYDKRFTTDSYLRKALDELKAPRS